MHSVMLSQHGNAIWCKYYQWSRTPSVREETGQFCVAADPVNTSSAG